MSAALREEIEARRRRGFDAAGYRIPRVAWYLGRWIRGDRLVPRLAGAPLRPHAGAAGRATSCTSRWRCAGRVGRLRGELEHHPYADISDHLRKIDSYTTLWARQAHAAGRRSNVVDMAAGASWAFFRNYVLKRGFLLGSAGFIVSVLNTHYTFAKLAKLRELVRAGAPRA